VISAALDADSRVVRVLATAASAVTSFVLHGSVLAAVVLWGDAPPGAVMQPSEAISIEIIRSDVLEAAQASAKPEVAASASSVQPVIGEQKDAAASSPEEPRAAAHVEEPATTSRLPEEAPEEPTLLRDAAPEPEEATAIPDAAPEPEEATAIPDAAPERSAAADVPEDMPPPLAAPPRPIERARREAPVQHRREHTRDEAREASRKGAAQSRAARGSAQSSGRVSASPGAAINYAAVVRARVASRKPPGPGRRGTVVVIFGVSASGGLAFASISRSSGDPGLDGRVLTAVRSAAPFPAPPSGASARQRQFSMPFHFQ
jgi:protein TonB